MKKALMKVLLIAMTLVTLLTVIPLSANATSDNKTKIFSYLTNEMGLNSAAACGIMANIEKESNFKPGTIIRDSNGLPSGGLCMWNGSRLNRLKKYCSDKGLNYLSIKGQLSYLEYELGLSQYKHIFNYLKNVSNTSSGAYDAAYYWCYYFEIPANKGTRSVQRGNAAIKSYWPTYGNKKITKPEIDLSSKKTAFDLNSSLTLKWTDGGDNADTYKLYVAEKNQKSGKYDWTNAKIYTTSALKQKIKANTLGAGDFAAYVRAINSPTTNYKDSSKIKFTVKCIDHEYVGKVIEIPTLTRDGKENLTCTVCNYKTTETIPALTYENLGDYPMTPPIAVSRTTDSVTLKWSVYEGATGYYVYCRIDGKWKLMETVYGVTEATVTGLESGTVYKFSVRAFVEDGDKTYKTYCSDAFTTATKTNAVELVSLDFDSDGNVILNWTKEKKADGYAIEMAVNGQGYKRIHTIKGNSTTTYTIEGIEKSKLRYFRVYAFVDAGNHNIYSEASNEKNTLSTLF